MTSCSTSGSFMTTMRTPAADCKVESPLVRHAKLPNKHLPHEWRVQNLHKSPVLRELAANPKHVQLLDKIYRATGLKSLAPQHDSLERIIAAKDVDTLVMIEKAHNLPILPNAAGISLGEEDLACLAQVGLEVKRCWFEEAASSSLKNSFGSR
eukprot:5628705-Amphidinium_carterae.1